MVRELEQIDSLIVAPVQAALDLDYVKLHIRALGYTDDPLIDVYVDQAASYFEEQTGRQIITATRELWIDAFPFVGATGYNARIEVPHPPLQSIVNVNYVDSDGVTQSYDDGGSPATVYWRDVAPAGPYCRRGWVEPQYGRVWPIARAQTGAVQIRYICGYGDSPDDVPELVRGILCFLVGHFDTYRSHTQEHVISAIPYGVKEMLDGFKFSAYPSQVLRETGVDWPVIVP